MDAEHSNICAALHDVCSDLTQLTFHDLFDQLSVLLYDEVNGFCLFLYECDHCCRFVFFTLCMTQHNIVNLRTLGDLDSRP